MNNFWDSSVWGFMMIMSVLLISLLLANLLKKSFGVLRASLIPTSVLGGLILLIIAVIFKSCTGENIYNTWFFAGTGQAQLETITFHCLAIGFIAMALKSTEAVFTKKRSSEIFNTGLTTVSTYLIQGVFGLIITIALAGTVAGLIGAGGILLPFGFGQGTGQAMNFGNIYEVDYGFTGGKNFGLTIAALGFLSAAIGGVVHLNILKKRGIIKLEDMGSESSTTITMDEIQNANEIPMNGGIDKLTLQIALIFMVYMATYIVIYLLGNVMPGMRTTLYGFNFLFGVILAAVLKGIIKGLEKGNVIKKKYINSFLMDRIGGFAFDLMIVAGVAAIQIDLLSNYWAIIILLAIVAILVTYFYNRFVAKKLFPEYAEEQFLAMYGMLTGTASTGIILLREIDNEFKTPVADNLVYQTIPAIVFGFPLMLLAAVAPVKPVMVLFILAGAFIVLNVILFRSVIFKRKK